MATDTNESCVAVMSSDRDEWLTKRRQAIGGSEAATVIGAARNAFSSPYSIWQSKRGIATQPDQSPSERAYWGSTLEPMIRKGYAERTGRTVLEEAKAPSVLMYRSTSYPWMQASLDGTVYDDQGRKGVLELKLVDRLFANEWETDGVPVAYQVQVQHNMVVTGRRWSSIGALFGGNELKVYDIERDDEFCRLMVEAEREWWHQHVVAGQEPSVDGNDATARAIKARFARENDTTITLPEAADSIHDELEHTKEALKYLLENKAKLENQLKLLIGDAAVGELANGTGRYSWRTTERKEYTVKASSSRTFRFQKAR